MSVQKINLPEIAESLHKEIIKIEKKKAPQAEKTRRHQRAAQKVLNLMYLDRRRFKGKNKENRISLNTFVSYLTKLRNMLGDMGLRHHLLDRELERMTRRYPGHADMLATMVGGTPKDTRIAKKAALNQLSREQEAHSGFNRIAWDKPDAKERLAALIEKYPELSARLDRLKLAGGRAAEIRSMHKYFDEADSLKREMIKLKVDHEAIVALHLPADLKNDRARSTTKSLEKKQRSVFRLDYPTYMEKVVWSLTQPHNQRPDDGCDWDYNALVFGLCAATGRRPIEVLLTGGFERIDRERLRFTGQAKKRDDAAYSYVIYSLVDTDVLLAAFNALRAEPYTVELHQLEAESRYDIRTTATMISNRLSAPLNNLARKVFAPDNRRVFYDVRAVYAAICAQRYLETDPRWRSGDGSHNRSAFTSELLGHDDPNAQLAYESVRLENYQAELATSVEYQIKDRVAELEKLDDEMPELARGGAAVAIHDWVKARLAVDPNIIITQSLISREVGGNRNTIKRYLEAASEALGAARDEKTGWIKSDADLLMEKPTVDWVSEPITEDDSDEPELDTEPEDEPEAPPAAPLPTSTPEWKAKPAFKFHRLANQQWQVGIHVGYASQTVTVQGANQMAAGRAAWQQWLAQWQQVQVHHTTDALNGKRAHKVSAGLPDGQYIEVVQAGAEAEAKRTLANDIKRAAAVWQNLGS